LAAFAALPGCFELSPPAAPPQNALPALPPLTAPAPPPPADIVGFPSRDASDDTEPADDDSDPYASETPDEDESADGAAPTATPTASAPSPLLALSDADLHARFKKDPTALGPISAGKPNAGALVNGVAMPKSPKWTVLEPGLAWGTQETIDGIARAIERVHTDFPATQAIPIGHISSRHGGYLPVHKSHQAGRDVDIGYYFTTPKPHFVTGNKANLDLPRTLAFVKALLAGSAIEMILIDVSIQKLLVDHAVAQGEDPAWLDRTFQVRQKPGYAPVRHVQGHRNHLHVRFASPAAVAMGRRVAGLVAVHAAPPPGTKRPAGAPAPTTPGEKIVAHRCRSGDTLVILARRYGTTVEAIRRANGLKGFALKAGHVYSIPVPPAPVRGAPLPQQQAKHPKKGKAGG